MPGRIAALLDQAVKLHRAGHLGQAERLYREALAIQSENPDALHLLGILAHQSGRPEIAVDLIGRAIARQPGSPDFHYNLAHVLHEQGRTAAAVGSLETVLRLAPGHPGARNDLAGLQRHAGRLDEAARHYRWIVQHGPAGGAALGDLAAVRLEQGHAEEAAVHFAAALALDPDDLDLRNGLIQALRGSDPDHYRPDLEQALLRCFAWPDVNHQHLAALAARQIRYKHGIGGAPGAGSAPLGLEIDRDAARGLFTDPLFTALLTRTINPDSQLEIFLTLLRRALLLGDSGLELSPEAEDRIMSALALQSFNNGYAFWAEPDEETRVAALGSELEAGSSAPDAVAAPAMLLQFAMYASPRGLSCAEDWRRRPLGAWPEPLRPVLEKTLVEAFEEEGIKAAIPTIGGIEDETSNAVRAQYEENPYPRWLAANRRTHVSFAGELQHRLPHFRPPAFLAGPLEILVAGCGTGLQPISLALSYRGARVVAVDLSRSSLAYAVRMARRLGLENIEFLQGDILQLSGLKRSFPVIECSGVLHHMDRPDQGLGVLCDLLRPGGVIKIGLYSKLGRRDLDIMRARFGRPASDAMPAGIRAFRHSVLASREAADFAAITGSADFNNTSGCRDLLFHTKERLYSLPELREMIGRQSLGFLGFDLDNPLIRRLYRTRFPDDPAMTDFDSWQSFEQQYPDSFANMYRFWCQKPRAA